MHKILSGDGFAVLNVDTLECLFSGSFKKCMGFVISSKSTAFSQGLAIVSADCANRILDSVNIQM